MKLLEKFSDEILESDEKRKVRFRFYGDISRLEPKLQKKIHEVEEKTKDNDVMTFGICLNYGGRDELIHAIKSIAQDVKDGKASVEDIDVAMVDSKLYTAGVPDPDFIIRTSGEKRLSNFLTWQSTYAELYFPEIYWPEFDESQMDKAIEEYIKRNRRFGGN